jgi:hypothetical protein
MKTKIKHWIAAEHTTTHHRNYGACPTRECDHYHRTRRAAENCAARHYPWTVYAVLKDGRYVQADNVALVTN